MRTGSISIEVAKIDPAMLQVRTAITGMGGYVSDSDQSNQADQQTASVTYRIPVARWQDALDAIKGIATKVDSTKSNAVEVTGQVLDLGARIDNLQTTETALQAIMARATKIADVLPVESQLSDVQGQIEQLSTQQAHLKDQASLATLSVLYALPPTPETVETSRGWDPGAQLDQASSALLGIGQVRLGRDLAGRGRPAGRPGRPDPAGPGHPRRSPDPPIRSAEPGHPAARPGLSRRDAQSSGYDRGPRPGAAIDAHPARPRPVDRDRDRDRYRRVDRGPSEASDGAGRVDRIEHAVREILTEIGEDPDREGLRGTPERIHRMYHELTAGYHVDPDRLINGAVFAVDYSEMVVVKGIEFYSLCEHHLLPFFGTAAVGYLPRDG